MQPVGPALDDPVLIRAIADRQARLVDLPADGGDDEAARRRVRKAMVAPLLGESTLMGTLLVSDPLSDISTFDPEDLKLFETLANHTAIALENGQLEQSLEQLGRLKEELHHQASHDSLTGLANRSLFTQVVASRLESRDASGTVPVVLFIDLDDFKLVNDSLGHAAGDALLVAVGERLHAVLAPGDIAARLGGDEFAVLLRDTPDMRASMRVANRLTAAMGPLFQIEGRDVNVRASIGVAAGRPGVETAGDLLRNADVAMYSAKARGKGRVVVFEPSMHDAVMARAQLSADLEHAIAAREFVLAVPADRRDRDGSDGRRRGARALGAPRTRPDRAGRLHPSGRGVRFDPGDRALGAQPGVPADARLARPRSADGPFTVSVNISARQLVQPDFVDEVLTIIREAGVDPAEIVLEMTETSMLQDSAATRSKLQDLRDAGIGVSIDDFGTGYSSLSYLQRFPVTTLKIARDFVDVDGLDPDAWELASAIVALGRALRLSVIAEGVEQWSQLGRLRTLGCEYAQGFYFARPLDPASIEHCLPTAASWRRRGLSTRAARPARSSRRGRLTVRPRRPARTGSARAPNRTFVPLAADARSRIVRIRRRQPGGLSRHGLQTRQTRREAGTQSQGSSGTVRPEDRPVARHRTSTDRRVASMVQVDRPEGGIRPSDAHRADRGWSLDFIATGPHRRALTAVVLVVRHRAGRRRSRRGYDPAADVNSMYNTTRTPAPRPGGRRLHRRGRRRRADRHRRRPVEGLATPGKIIYGPDLSLESQAPDLHEPRHERPRDVHGRAHRRERRRSRPRRTPTRRRRRTAAWPPTRGS